MKLLIVDDEMYVVRAIKKSIDWPAIQIDTVFTAFNIEKAKEIIQKETVDMILTDIEMPGGSGLDLIRWARLAGYDAVCLCLTCHAEFHYAKDAISLGVTDFYVKPVNFPDLSQKLRQVVCALVARRAQEKQRLQGVYWEKNLQVIQNSFWLDLLQGRLGENPTRIINEAAKRQVAYFFDHEYILAMICVRSDSETEQWADRRALLTYALQNVADDVLEDMRICHRMMDAEHLLFICEGPESEDLSGIFQAYMNICLESLGVSLVIYLSPPTYGEALPRLYQAFIQFDKENLYSTGVFQFGTDEEPFTGDCEPSRFDAMRTHLKKEEYQDFLGLVQTGIAVVSKQGKSELSVYLLDIIQLIGELLSDKGWMLHDLIGEDDGLLPAHALQTTASAMQWSVAITHKLEEMIRGGKDEQVIVEKTMAYIHDHLENKLSRQEIAAKVFLSADYLNKLFKKVTGSSLIQYVIDAKMAKAARQIAEGTKHIGAIATGLGYDNFSYFSNLFKKSMGVSPTEYKRNCQKID